MALSKAKIFISSAISSLITFMKFEQEIARDFFAQLPYSMEGLSGMSLACTATCWHYQPSCKFKSKPKRPLILELAIHYRRNGEYPPGLSRDKKRAVRKRASALVCGEKGEVFMKNLQYGQVRVMLCVQEHTRILNAWHTEPHRANLEHWPLWSH